MVADPTKVALVECIHQMHVEGAFLPQIATTLNAEGISSKSGEKWCAGTVRYMLNNDLYDEWA